MSCKDGGGQEFEFQAPKEYESSLAYPLVKQRRNQTAVPDLACLLFVAQVHLIATSTLML